MNNWVFYDTYSWTKKEDYHLFTFPDPSHVGDYFKTNLQVKGRLSSDQSFCIVSLGVASFYSTRIDAFNLVIDDRPVFGGYGDKFELPKPIKINVGHHKIEWRIWSLEPEGMVRMFISGFGYRDTDTD